eukprot:2819461-Ditylum_brightwellii.AAC.1
MGGATWRVEIERAKDPLHWESLVCKADDSGENTAMKNKVEKIGRQAGDVSSPKQSEQRRIYDDDGKEKSNAADDQKTPDKLLNEKQKYSLPVLD